MIGRKGWFVITSLIFIVALILVLITFPPWESMAKWLDINNRPEKVDVLITLGGDSERELYAAELYRFGFATKVIMTGYGSSVVVMANRAVQAGVPAQDIIMEDKSVSTYENAVYSKEIVLKQNYKSAIVVSSPYHMRRTKLVFGRVFRNTGVKLLYCSTMDSGFNVDGKCTGDHDRQLVKREYIKLLYYWFRYW